MFMLRLVTSEVKTNTTCQTTDADTVYIPSFRSKIWKSFDFYKSEGTLKVEHELSTAILSLMSW